MKGTQIGDCSTYIRGNSGHINGQLQYTQWAILIHIINWQVKGTQIGDYKKHNRGIAGHTNGQL